MKHQLHNKFSFGKHFVQHMFHSHLEEIWRGLSDILEPEDNPQVPMSIEEIISCQFFLLNDYYIEKLFVLFII